jgi:hypothetical protein
MKLEQMATLLKKDATELVRALNLTEGQEEVSDDIAVKEINNFIREIEISKLSEGKKQGEGMAKRTILSDAEKKIKEKFNVEGASFDDLIESLSSKVNSQPTDDKFKKEIDLWKAKHDDLTNKYNGLLTNVTKIDTKAKVTSKLSTVFDKIDFPSGKVKEIAINDFVEQYQFEEAESGLYAKQGERVIIDIENLALTHFREYGKVKEVQSAKPNVTFPNTSYTGSKTMEELFAEIPKAKTAEERVLILEEIKKLETAKK